MRPEKINLTLHGRGPVLASDELLTHGLLQLTEEHLGAGEQGLNEVLPVDGLEMPPIWKKTNKQGIPKWTQ